MDRVREIQAQLALVKAAEPTLEPPQLDVIREIIYLRRRVDRDVHAARFKSLLQAGGESQLLSFSTRWLVSIADTYADHGSPGERANAMIIVVLANMTKLAETERRYLKDADIDPQRREEFVTPGKPLWDGMDSYAITQGDMPMNMWTRVRAIMAETPALLFIFETILSRMAANDTLIGRLAALNQKFY